MTARSESTFDSAEVAFFSDGARIAGELFLPSGSGRWPVVVVCPGWGSLRDYPNGQDFCRRLASAGIGALIFNYRGYGDSEGRRDRLIPTEMLTDVRAAFAYLEDRPDVDGSALGAMGMLTGAAVALQAASEMSAVAAVVAWYPFGDGSRWMRALRSNWDWTQFLERIRRDRIVAAQTGASELVDHLEILPRDPLAAKRDRRLRELSPARAAWRLSLASADAILSFRPQDHFHRISPRPTLLVALEDDQVLPVEVARAAFEELPEPKQLILVRGVDHHDIYSPTHLDPLFAEIVAFLTSAFDRARSTVVRHEARPR